MANALFDPGREGILDATISVSIATVKAVLVRGYTFSAAHKFVSDMTGAGGVIVATSGALATKTETNGIFDALDVVWAAVPTGAAITSCIIYQSSAVTGGADIAATAQRLIGYIDTATGLPITPNGTDITCVWDNTTNKIFKL